MNIKIRIATSRDVTAISSVHIKCWHETYTGIIPQSYLNKINIEQRQKTWLKAIKQGQTIFIAEHNNKVIGFATGGKNRSCEINANGELYAIYLLQEYQGKGIGKRLFENVKENLLSRDLTPFIAWVLEQNLSCDFYEKMRGRIIADKFEDIGDVLFKELAYIWEG